MKEAQTIKHLIKTGQNEAIQQLAQTYTPHYNFVILTQLTLDERLKWCEIVMPELCSPVF